MNNIFNDSYKEQQQQDSDQTVSARIDWKPVVDVGDTEKELTIYAELPGVVKEDVNIEFHEDVLTISGKKNHVKKDESEKYYMVERAFGNFSRSFRLPRGVDANNISASFKDGVLEILIPKSKTEPAKQKIKIKD